MRFQIQRKPNQNIQHYHDKDMDIAYKFSKRIYDEFGNFLKAVVLFGAVAKRKTKRDDIDILVIVDDAHIIIEQEMVDAYRVIMEKIVSEVSPKLHVTTLKFTNFWDYARAGDPIIVNILRDGVPLIDSSFFEPLQLLLVQGRIRPSPESVWSYYGKAPITLDNSQWHILQAVLDLYWAAIDAAHAALMSKGEVPASPEHVAEIMRQKLVKTRELDARYPHTLEKLYELSKKIVHRETRSITGKDYDGLFEETREFVKAMKKIIEKK